MWDDSRLDFGVLAGVSVDSFESSGNRFGFRNFGLLIGRNGCATLITSFINILSMPVRTPQIKQRHCT
jgi:hypothetical protein